MQSGKQVTTEELRIDVELSLIPQKMYPIDFHQNSLDMFQNTHKNLKIEASSDASGKCFIPLRDMHGFFLAVLKAFTHHLTLVICPDDFYQLVLEGLSRHVELNSAVLRSKFVNFQGKKSLVVNRNSFRPYMNNDWEGVFSEFADQIRENTVSDTYEKIVGSPFSSTTKLQMVARNISLMSITKHYFRFGVRTSCGIPSIRMLGSLKDWKDLKAKVLALDGLMMPDFSERWLSSLDSIMDKFIEAKTGVTDELFWRSICKYNGAKGSGDISHISGWINAFFPYLRKEGLNRFIFPWKEYVNLNGRQGPQPKEFGHTYNNCPVTWMYYEEEIKLEIRTGFYSPAYHEEEKEIRPGIGWVLIRV